MFEVGFAQEDACAEILARRGDLIRSYDFNRNEMIDKGEAYKAARGWVEGKITGDDLLDIIRFSVLGCKISKEKIIRIIFPNGGEKLEIGRGYQIQWESKKVSEVDIDLLKGRVLVAPLAKRIASRDGDQNFFYWEIKERKVEAGTDYFIRIRDTKDPSVSDQSDKPFEIIKPCKREKPTLDLWPERKAAKAGEEIEYNVLLSNNDSLGCEASNFQLSATCPAGWACKLSKEILNLKPNHRGKTELLVTSPATASPGEYEIIVRAVHQADTSLFAEDKAKLAILPPREDPVSGFLSVDKRRIMQGEELTLKIEAKDEQGVVAIYAWFKDNWNKFDCKSEKKCTATFTFKEERIGTNYYYGYVVGKKLDGSSEANWTKPPYVWVEVIPVKPSIKVLLPTRGDKWNIGGTYEIKWQSSQVEKVNIELWFSPPGYEPLAGKEAGGKKVLTIATEVPAKDQVYKWTIPDIVKPGNYRIKIYSSLDPSVRDFSDPFIIEKPVLPR